MPDFMAGNSTPDDLSELVGRIEKCDICIKRPMGAPLPHAPRPVVRASSTARVCIAGQAPGLRVHESGIPFNDPSGDRLREWMNVDRDTFYDSSRIAIVPMGFCFPGYDKNKSDLPPRRECVLEWHDGLFKLMPQIELIIVIGQYAQKYHLPALREKSVTATVQNWRRIFEHGQGRRFLPLPHPSWRNTGWLKRNPWFEQDVLPVLRREVERLLENKISR